MFLTFSIKYRPQYLIGHYPWRLRITAHTLKLLGSYKLRRFTVSIVHVVECGTMQQNIITKVCRRFFDGRPDTVSVQHMDTRLNCSGCHSLFYNIPMHSPPPKSPKIIIEEHKIFIEISQDILMIN